MDYAYNELKKSLREIAVIYIKESILSGKYKSGDKILELEISKELNISRAPIREALSEMSIQGILDFLPRKGCQVVEMTKEDLLEIFSIRTSLENQILELLVNNQMLKEADFDNLYRLINEMLENEDVDMDLDERIYKLNKIDLEFHSYLWEVSKSKRRAKILEGEFLQLLIAMNGEIETLGTFKEKAEEHLIIVNALKSKDLTLASKTFTEHIENYVKAILGKENILLFTQEDKE